MVSLALRGSAEVAIGEDNWSHKGPDVEEEADPAGADLDPHSWPLAGHIPELRIRAKKTKECQEKESDTSIKQLPHPKTGSSPGKLG